MGIEKDIHQNTFKSARQKAMINLLYTYGWILEQVKNFLGQEDITHQQFNILRILRGAMPQPLSTLQIRERMIDKMSDTSRIVDRLLAKELVEKTTCTKDKRLVDVSISAKGLELLERIDQRSDHVQEIMGKLTEEEATQLSNLLDQIRG
ncbi:MAG: MarR family transcriptional regulator [Chitinophagaceae bacterium]|nr:MAG: MarR family transcriptional regulator [Chitinophagaceae bacterium]